MKSLIAEAEENLLQAEREKLQTEALLRKADDERRQVEFRANNPESWEDLAEGDALRARVGTMKAARSLAVEAINAKGGEVRAAAEKLRILRNEARRIEADLLRLPEEMRSRERRVSQAQAEIARLEQEAARARNEIETLQTQEASMRGRLQALTGGASASVAVV